MSCIIGLNREPLVQRLHVVCALWVQRVNRCVEKGLRLVAVLSLLRNDFSSVHSRCLWNETAKQAQPLISNGRSILRPLGATPQ
jgi:hypothetical protein